MIAEGIADTILRHPFYLGDYGWLRGPKHTENELGFVFLLRRKDANSCPRPLVSVKRHRQLARRLHLFERNVRPDAGDAGQAP